MEKDDFLVPSAKECKRRLNERYPERAVFQNKMKAHQLKIVYRHVMRRVRAGEAVGDKHRAQRIARQLGIEYCGPQLNKKRNVILYHIFNNNFGGSFGILNSELSLDAVRGYFERSNAKFTALPPAQKELSQ